MRARRTPETFGDDLRRNRIRWVIFHTTTTGERDRVIDLFRAGSEIDTIIDLDHFYGLGLRRISGGLTDPNVWVVHLGS